MNRLITSFIKQKVNIVIAEWYELFTISESFKTYFVLSRHYSKRIFKKFNSTLWGGFVIRYRNATGLQQAIYYGADSGYGNHFKEIKKLFNPDIAVLPIGSYKPRWFMKQNHASPAEAVQVLKDCGAVNIIPMHYSTFNLSNENMNEPKEKIKELTGENILIDLIPGQAYML